MNNAAGATNRKETLSRRPFDRQRSGENQAYLCISTIIATRIHWRVATPDQQI